MRQSAAALVVLTIVYATALLLIDQSEVESTVFWTIGRSLPLAALFTFLGFVLRYLRWCGLLRRRGYVVPLGPGFLAYLAGFALTASPGKVGELIRIRYFSAIDVPADQVTACFVFERSLDLFALLLLSMLLAGSAPGLGLGLTFVVIVAASVYVLAQLPGEFVIGLWSTCADAAGIDQHARSALSVVGSHCRSSSPIGGFSSRPMCSE